MIDFVCPACAYSRQISDRLSGRKWRCPSCNAKIKHRGGSRFQIREVGNLPDEPGGTSNEDDLPEASLDSAPVSIVPSAPSKPAPDQLAGTLLGHYRLMELIGSGSGGHVYRAEHETLKRKAAVKVLSPTLTPSADRVARLAQEAVALAKVEHPHVVRVYDFGVENDTPYLAMQLIEGPSLSKALKTGGTFTNDRLLKLGRELLAGLDAIHQAGLLHRDIKPGNILLDQTGQAFLADFSLAWELPPASTTTSSTFSGTAEYAAPELALGQAPDARSDLYALGGTLYRAVTGRPPFGGTTVAEKLKKQLHEPLTPARAFYPELAPELEALIVKLLSKERTDRPSSAREAALILNPAPPPPAPPAPRAEAEAKPALRVVSVRTESTPLVPVLVAGGVLLAVLIGILFLGTRPRTTPPAGPPPALAKPAAPEPARTIPPESRPKVDETEKADLEHLQHVIATAPVTAAIQACSEFLDKHPKSAHVESVLLKKVELHQELQRLSGKGSPKNTTMWTFRLKSGAKIQAPSYEELPDAYLLKVGGTSIRLAKEEVDDVLKGESQEK